MFLRIPTKVPADFKTRMGKDVFTQLNQRVNAFFNRKGQWQYDIL